MSKNKSVESRIIETKSILWRDLHFLQDDTFKEISQEERAKLRASILDRGFVDPFFVWLDPKSGIMFCLDGKHRTDELELLVTDGYEVPDELPATFVRCKDKKEAAELVLVYSSFYAKITSHGFYDFLQQHNLDLNSIGSSLNIPELNIEEMTKLPDYTGNNKELNIEEFDGGIEVKFSFTKEEYLKFNQQLKALQENASVPMTKEAILLEAVNLCFTSFKPCDNVSL